VVARVGIQETQEFTPGNKVYDLVDSGEWERILRASLVQAHVIYTHPPFPILFWYENWIGYPVWVLDLLNEASGKSLDSSSPMARCFSWLKHRRPCLIGFELGLMLRVCSTTSWEMPSNSIGFHANMSMLRWRKSISSLSYLGSKLTSIYTVLAGSLALIHMALASSSILKTPDGGGMVGLSGFAGTWRLSSLSSAVATIVVANVIRLINLIGLNNMHNSI
jgi:hypothetical protein